MKPKTLILIVAAVGCGLAASYMTSKLLADKAKDQQVEEEKVAVLVAKQKIAMGTLVKNPEQLFVKKEFTKGQEPKKALNDFTQVKDKRLNKPLSEEQFLTSEDLIDGKDGGSIEVRLPPGMRAVAIKANVELSSGGFVLPNSRVDLIITVKRGDHDSWSRIFMQNMLVLAVDQIKDHNAEQQHFIPSVVTFAATPEEAEKLSMAQTMGELRMVLRPFGEESAVHTRGVTPKDVARTNGAAGSGISTVDDGSEASVPGGLGKLPEFGQPKPVEPVVTEQPPAPPPPKTHVMRIENGESVTKAVFVIGENGDTTTRDIERYDPVPRPEKHQPVPEPPQTDKPVPAPASTPAPISTPVQPKRNGT